MRSNFEFTSDGLQDTTNILLRGSLEFFENNPSVYISMLWCISIVFYQRFFVKVKFKF